MAAPTQPAPPSQGSPTAASAGLRSWSIDDLVVLLFALFGLAGGVFFPRLLHIPPITTSFLLASGLAALAYRFLGGIEGASFAVGSFKLGGSLAALVGIAMLINHALVPETQPPPAPPPPPLHQAYHVTGTVVDNQGNPVNGLQTANFLVSPQGANANPQGGSFSLVIANGIDFNGNPTFPFLTVNDGSQASNTYHLQPAPGDGLEIPLGKIQLHPASAANSAPAPAAAQTAALTPTPEQNR